MLTIRSWFSSAGHYRAALWLATLLAAAWSLPFLGRKSFWLDEVLSIELAQDWSAMRADSNMWLYHLLLRGWLHWGLDESTVRLLPALFAIATVPLLGLLARHLFGAWAGGTAALLLACNPFFHRYAAEARAYSLLLMLVVASSWFYLRLIHEPRRRWWIGFVLCSAAGVYAHFFAALVTGVQFLALLARRPPPQVFKAFVLALGCIALMLLPIPLLAPLGSNIDWLPIPNHQDLLRTLRSLSGSRMLFWLYVLATCGSGLLWWRDRQHERRWATAFVLIWLCMPVLLTYWASQVWKPMFLARYLIICLPALCLVAACALSRIPGSLPKLGVVLVFLALSVPGLAENSRALPGWREISKHLVAQGRAGDGAMVFADFRAPTLAFYLTSQKAAWPRLERLNRVDLIPEFAARYQRVWLLLEFHDRFHPGSSKRALEIQATLSSRFRVVEEMKLGEVRTLLYSQPKTAN